MESDNELSVMQYFQACTPRADFNSAALTSCLHKRRCCRPGIISYWQRAIQQLVAKSISTSSAALLAASSSGDDAGHRCWQHYLRSDLYGSAPSSKFAHLSSRIFNRRGSRQSCSSRSWKNSFSTAVDAICRVYLVIPQAT